jgi:hypothetical protein
VGIVRDLARPYKTEHDRDVRRLACDFAQQVGAGEPVILCHESEKAVLAELLWYLRTAPFDLHWLRDADAVPPARSACWLVLCGHEELDVVLVLSVYGARAEGWRPAESDARLVPPENAKMPTVYCRWVRLVRTER